MIFGQLFKKGTNQKRSDGSVLRVNEDNGSYVVDKADLAIWNQCDGVTFEALCNSVASKIGWQVPHDVLSHLERYVNWCIYAKLIEVRSFTPDQFASLMKEQNTDFERFKRMFLETIELKP